MANLIETKSELCTMLSRIIKVTDLTVNELTENTKGVQSAYEKALQVLADKIFVTPIKKQSEMKSVFKEFYNMDEEALKNHILYLGTTFNIVGLSEMSNEGILQLLERIEKYENNFKSLYAMGSGYARNEQILNTYRWLTQKQLPNVEDEAVRRGLMECDYVAFEW